MGPSGYGKSSFINHLAGKELAKVHDFEAITNVMAAYKVHGISNFKKPVILIDCPGFKDTH